jgi:AAA family ATP:ADP antiporter
MNASDTNSPAPPSVPQIVVFSGLAFALCVTYELARSPVESLFLEAYTVRGEPYAWLAVAIAAVAAVTVYNRYSARVELAKVFGAVAWLSAGILAGLLLLVRLKLPGAEMLLYVWKDVYIVVLFEIFWTVANTRFGVASARWTYGFFCVVGSLGGYVGGQWVAAYAQTWGIEGLLWTVVSLLVLTALARNALGQTTAPVRKEHKVAVGLQVLKESRYLVWMLMLIAIVQIVINLVDFQYKGFLEMTYPDAAERAAVGGEVYSWISIGAVVLQLLTGPILTVIGVRLTLLFIPLVIAGSVMAFVIAPRFLTVVLAKVAGKCFDYSLFRAGKEILYIPLSYEEKTQGKAFVDMMTYRVAKGVASLLALVLIAIDGVSWLSALILSLVALWFAVTVPITKRYQRRLEREKEAAL